jgi:hypothetical protein
MTEPRCYTVAQVLTRLQLSRRQFFRLKASHQLPMLEELLPRLGARPRFRADLVDRYLSNQFHQPRSLASHRKVS